MKLFGTDGIRGTANSTPMTPEFAMRVALAAGRHFRHGDYRHRVVIGKDTRLSGYMLETAMIAGFTSMGMDVFLLGPIPTPAVGMLVPSLRADCGVMISASHNPYQDNGIKFFGPDGFKLSDAVERAIERYVGETEQAPRASPSMTGRAQRLEDGRARYIEMVKASFPRNLTLNRLKIVVDCAHGASYRTAPDVLWELGADIHAIGVAPDGTNINEGCGSTAPGGLREAVLAQGAALGMGFDGDADRVILVDEQGGLIDGDQIMALIATRWQAQGRLRGGGVVATHMSNLGFERYLAGIGLSLTRTRIGDRHVVAAMRAKGFNLGGEQSGHLILRDYATTGDGLIAALQVLPALVEEEKPASEVCRLFEPVPQALRNIRLRNGADDPLQRRAVRCALDEGTARLGRTGRLFARKSGTEPLIRVMGESADAQLLQSVLEEVCATIERALDDA